MSKRKHISWKTKCACALMEVDWLRSVIYGKRLVPYDDAKQMTETQFLSLWQWDHNKLFAFGGGDHFTNLTPEPIMVHREKTKQDAKIIAKSRRIRAKNTPTTPIIDWKIGPTIGAYWMSQDGQLYKYEGGKPRRVSKIRSRGFDKTLRKKMSGKVEKR